MKMLRWLNFGFLMAAAWGAPGCSLRESKALPPVEHEASTWQFRDRQGTLLKTEHYEVYTTVQDPVLLEALPQMMEASFAHYRSLVPAAQPPREPLRVYIFSRRNDWEHFTRRLTGPRAPEFLRVVHGGYSEAGVSVIEYTSNMTTFPIMGHEGFHQYLYTCVGRSAPAWLNEGLAVYCEGLRWSGGRVNQLDAWNNPFRRNALADALVRDKLYPLRELLRINAGHVIGTNAERIATYYGQLWGLMLYLKEGEGGRYAEPFAELCTRLATSDLDPHVRAAQLTHAAPLSHGEAVFSAFITPDFDAFEAGFREFLTDRLYTSRRK